MSGDGRRAATLALVLLFAAPAASLRQGEKLGEDYLRVSTSVAVIHARGREVTAEGLVRGPMSARRAT